MLEHRDTIVVGIATYRRTAGLAALLESLCLQELSEDQSLAIVVVDNDTVPSAKKTVDRVAARGPLKIRYFHEPTPGIAAARNVALREATSADYLLFIDDDETAQVNWAATLVNGLKTTGADVAHGSVTYVFPSGTPQWIIEGGYFVNVERRQGERLPYAATNNLALDMRRVSKLGSFVFNLELGLTGGSDVEITSQIVAAGGSIVWWPEAVVTEIVPAERATRAWAIRRARRTGESGANLALTDDGHLQLISRARLALEAMARVVWGASRAIKGLLLRDSREYGHGIRNVMRGVGIARRIGGVRTNEYAR